MTATAPTLADRISLFAALNNAINNWDDEYRIRNKADSGECQLLCGKFPKLAVSISQVYHCVAVRRANKDDTKVVRAALVTCQQALEQIKRDWPLARATFTTKRK